MSGEVRRFFVPALPAGGETLELPEEVGHHLRVLRLVVGDSIVLFDGSGREAVARLSGLDPACCEVHAPTEAVREGPSLHLVQALPKGKKLDAIVRMATELGVDEIHLAISERSVSRPDGRRAGGKIERLRRVAQEAARQARRRTVPVLHPVASLGEVAQRATDAAARFVFWENANEALPRAVAVQGAVWVIVGPEGGLSYTEVGDLTDSGFEAVGLGRSILRVETAAPVAVALILDRLGRLSSSTGSNGADNV